jgi:LPS export ABC transporter protein LptC
MIRPLLLISFTALLLLSQQGCANDPEKVKKITMRDTLPLQTAMGVDVLYSDSAKLKIHLTAPKVEQYAGNRQYEEMTKGVRVEFYDDEGKVDSYLTANYAIRRVRDNMMEAKNDVVVVNTKGEKLNTEHLIWDGNKRRITTESSVKITTADQIIMGTGLESDETFTNYEIKNITGTFTLKEGEDK